LAAFRRALARGARGVESDVWLTADGEAVLHHDGVLGPPGRRRRIPDLPGRRLPSWVPTLADLYAAGGDEVDLSLDIKDPRHRETVRRVLAVARAAGPRPLSRLWLCGGITALRLWREEDGQVNLVNTAAVNEVDDGARLEGRLRELAELQVAAINLRAPAWAAWMVDRVHEHGLLAFGWDAQPRATIRRLLRYGVDGVYSDHLARLVQLTRAAATTSI
jgi:glycerophosphoryl diester phosphodiesterase